MKPNVCLTVSLLTGVAIAAGPPYAPSKVVRGVTFAPESSIARQAIESDNWPITWADDDALYTSYGDGWGFEPKTGLKLSIGLAKVTGPPDRFRPTSGPPPLNGSATARKAPSPAGS